jgi:hypothetical protein
MKRLARTFHESQEVVFVVLIHCLTLGAIYAFNASRLVV